MVEIEKWIRKQLNKGYTPEQIKQSLSQSGHDSNIVDKVLAEPTSKKSKTSNLFKIGIILVAIVVLGLFFLFPFIQQAFLIKFTKEQTENVGTKAEQQIKCIYADFDVAKIDVKYDFTKGILNVTIYNRGTEDVYNFSFIVITDKGAYNFEPINQREETNPLSPRQIQTFLTRPLTQSPSETEVFNQLRILAICGKEQKITKTIDMR